jgi:hypothetical protein
MSDARSADNLGAADSPRLVAYSLVADPTRIGEHTRQFSLSVATLRAHNPSIPVVLFVHGELPGPLALLCHQHDVMVHYQGPYRDRLARYSPSGADALARYPVLHKNLNFAELARTGARQVLCCDLDTIFFADVAELFDRYATPHVVAREEVHSERSLHGVDRAFIDEPLLQQIAARLGRSAVAPFNLGFVLYNHGVVEQLVHTMGLFIDDVWRLLTGIACRNHRTADADAMTSFPWMEAVAAAVTEYDIERALPFPSNNDWIVEEVALWLTLGALPGLTTGDFLPADVAQNGEVLGATDVSWIACHYYSQNLSRILDWIDTSHSERRSAAATA